MEYHRYFELFLNIEDDLLSYIRQLEYSEKSRSIYSPRLALLLLQTCPIIESYMVRLANHSDTVKKHDIYDWEYNWRIWDRKKKEKKVKERDGIRSIYNFPKFSYVCEKVFGISGKSVTFFFSDRFQTVSNNKLLQIFRPYESLNKFEPLEKFDKNSKRFPIGLETPKWWTSYNKIKHSFGEEAEERVTYERIIEGLAGLFLILAYCDADYKVLKANGYMTEKNVIKTKLFETL